MKALVTGGGGFLGGGIARALVARGDAVRSLGAGRLPELRRAISGVETIRGDIGSAGEVKKAVEGADVVFHVAAKAGVWGPYQDYYRANVEGTRNVIAACRAAGVRRLVYTSSPSIVFNGRDMEGVDESAPYPDHHDAPYPATKAEAERLALGANGPAMAVVSLRPHLIWGPGDNHLVPRIVARAKSGRLRRIGREDKTIDATYIDNAVDAHLRAADRLAPGATIAGKAYFIAQGEPMPIWDLVNGVLEAAGLPPLKGAISPRLALLAGAVCEGVYRGLNLKSEPPMTRFVARELSTSHWFNLDAARRDLGYSATVSTQEGLKRLAEWLRGRG